jgi:serine protease Do
MKLRKVACILCLVVLVTLQGVSRALDQDLQQSINTVVSQVKPALVRIYVVSTAYRGGRELKRQSAGSGVIITPEGHVVTNHHVAGHATQLICTLSNREEIPAELIATDPSTDISIIKLLPEDGRSFPVATFGDSDALKVGDSVLAMGSPMALSQSVTLGIVSNTEMVMPRRMGVGSFWLDGEDVGGLVRWIAHDAFIFGGNSGGPLIDMNGKIVGINEISFALAGAIPGNLVKGVAESLLEFGKVERSWLGMMIQPLFKTQSESMGAFITGTVKGSPAEDAGVQSGDILLSLNGTPTRARFDEDMPILNKLLSELPIGQEIALIISRDGQEKTLKVTPVERESRESKQSELKEWGVTVRNITFMMAKELRRENQDGVYITSIRPGGPAGEAKPNLLPGDVIVSVGDRLIQNVEALREATREMLVEDEETTPLLVTFDRRSKTFVTVANVGIRDLNDPGLEVKKAWLPIETQVLTRDIAKALNTPDRKGFRVIQVFSDSTAEKAGLLEGDIIYRVDDEPLTASEPEHYEELPVLIRNYRVGSTVTLDIDRSGEELAINVELILAPKLAREMKKYRDDSFEFTVRNTSFMDDVSGKWEPDEIGVLVDEVKRGGWAAIGMLYNNDLIQEVNGIAIENVETFKTEMLAVEEDQADVVLIKVLRGIYSVYIELEPQWTKN